MANKVASVPSIILLGLAGLNTSKLKCAFLILHAQHFKKWTILECFLKPLPFANYLWQNSPSLIQLFQMQPDHFHVVFGGHREQRLLQLHELAVDGSLAYNFTLQCLRKTECMIALIPV